MQGRAPRRSRLLRPVSYSPAIIVTRDSTTLQVLSFLTSILPGTWWSASAGLARWPSRTARRAAQHNARVASAGLGRRCRLFFGRGRDSQTTPLSQPLVRVHYPASRGGCRPYRFASSDFLVKTYLKPSSLRQDGQEIVVGRFARALRRLVVRFAASGTTGERDRAFVDPRGRVGRGTQARRLAPPTNARS